MLVLGGVLLLLFGFYTSLELYLRDKLSKDFQDLGLFIASIKQDQVEVNLENASQILVFLRTPEGKVYVTRNADFPTDPSLYYSFFSKYMNGYHFVTYLRSLSVSEFLRFTFKNPKSLGIPFSGFILLLLGMYMSLASPVIPTEEVHEIKPVRVEKVEREEELMKHLKALRLALATSRIIPEESVQIAKDLIDNILKGGEKT